MLSFQKFIESEAAPEGAINERINGFGADVVFGIFIFQKTRDFMGGPQPFEFFNDKSYAFTFFAISFSKTYLGQLLMLILGFSSRYLLSHLLQTYFYLSCLSLQPCFASM